jgi:hypothetical protein
MLWSTGMGIKMKSVTMRTVTLKEVETELKSLQDFLRNDLQKEESRLLAARLFGLLQTKFFISKQKNKNSIHCKLTEEALIVCPCSIPEEDCKEDAKEYFSKIKKEITEIFGFEIIEGGGK